MKAGSTRIAGMEIGLLLLSLAGAKAQTSGPVIPAISGTVVDAITGRPVAGVDVTLRVQPSRGESLRYENVRTSPLGRFSFPSSVGPDAELFSSGVGEIAITVNIPFVSLDRLRALSGDKEIDSDRDSDASGFLSWDPLFTAKSTRVQNAELKGPRVGNKAYFPMAVQFLKACEQFWGANCIGMETTRKVRVPLIPVLDNAAGCKKIADPDVREGCRQLQIYRAAFRHLETMAQLRAAKEICSSIDHGPISQLCLVRLHTYIVRPTDYEDRPPLRMEIDSPEDALIVTPIAGMPVVSPSLAGSDPFTGYAMYVASYRRDTRAIFGDAVRVQIELPGNVDEIRTRFARLLTAVHGRFEMFDGSPLIALGDDRSSSVAWVSGDKIVTVSPGHLTAAEFRNFVDTLGENAARATELTPAMQREVIRSYLRKYPPSN
jgi:hypothetical protein